MSAPHHDTTLPELSLPTIDLRWAARRAALPLALAAAALAVILLAGTGPLTVAALSLIHI